MADLKKDFEYFTYKRAEWLLSHKGQFVVIRDGKEIGFFPTAEEGLRAGLSAFGNTDFLIQEITDEVRVNYISSHFVA